MDVEDARRVLVVEDDPLTSTLLQDVLEANGFAVEVAASARDARRSLDDFDPDAALLDIQLGDGPSGVALGHLITREYPATGVLFLTRYPDITSAGLSHSDIPEGCGFLRKDKIADVAYLLDALEATLRDRSRDYRQDVAEDSPLRNLTPNQLSVLRMVAQGLTNPAIGRSRGTSDSAVEQMLAGIYRNLGIEHSSEISARMRAARIYIAAAGLPEEP